MIALRVDVDDRTGALQEWLPDQLLKADRLAGSETACEQTCRRAAALGSLAGVEENGRARAGQRVADIRADLRSGVGDRMGNHRSDLVGKQMLTVLGQGKSG